VAGGVGRGVLLCGQAEDVLGRVDVVGLGEPAGSVLARVKGTVFVSQLERRADPPAERTKLYASFESNVRSGRRFSAAEAERALRSGWRGRGRGVSSTAGWVGTDTLI